MGGAPVIETIRPGVQFTPEAAASFRRLEARLGRKVDVNSTYRDWDTQMRMYLAWNAYVNGTGPYPGHSRALHPSLSVHCQGNALDSDDWTTPGFNALAAEHGWIRTAANDPTERHHFEYQRWNDRHYGEPAPAAVTLPKEEPEMIIIYVQLPDESKHVCGLGNGLFTHFVGDDQEAIFRDINRQPRVYEFGIGFLPRLLKKYGCDRDIWDYREGKFVVLDPLDGSVAQGNTWSADRATRGALRGIKLPELDYAKLAAAVSDAVAKAIDENPLEVDEELLADKVATAVLGELPPNATAAEIAAEVKRTLGAALA